VTATSGPTCRAKTLVDHRAAARRTHVEHGTPLNQVGPSHSGHGIGGVIDRHWPSAQRTIMGYAIIARG